jgi:anti-anti-sigma regulatory factor
VVVDLDDASFIDLIGIKALVDARKRLLDDGGRLHIVARMNPCARSSS